MAIGDILGYITSILQEWGIMPYIQAAIFIIVVVGVFVGIRSALQK